MVRDLFAFVAMAGAIAAFTVWAPTLAALIHR